MKRILLTDNFENLNITEYWITQFFWLEIRRATLTGSSVTKNSTGLLKNLSNGHTSFQYNIYYIH